MTAPHLCDADTRIPPEYTRRFGCEELHGVHFQHKDDRGGSCTALVISVPEVPTRRIKVALALARSENARVAFTCDTAAQARRMHRLATRLLPDHGFVSMERAAAGAWGLSA
jgi:hypothetical protein